MPFLKNTAFDIIQVSDLIRSRRSIYPPHYTGETIEKQTIEKLLENANWAPTHKLTQPWRFKIFFAAGKDALLDKMIDILKEAPPSPTLDKKIDKFNIFKTKVSHILAIILHRDSKVTIPEIEEVAAVACAVQNIYLSLNALELGGYWSTGGGTYSKTMWQYLKLTPEEKCLGFFYLGKSPRLTSQNPQPIVKRKPIAEKVEWFEQPL